MPTNRAAVCDVFARDFLGAKVPEALQRRLDVTDFGTPVATVQTTQQGNNVRMVIEPRGQWEHNAYQSDTQFVIEVKPVQSYSPDSPGAGTAPMPLPRMGTRLPGR